MDKKIIKACVKYKGKLYTGFDHGECFVKLQEEYKDINSEEIEQGFVDNDMIFVDRKEAMIIARQAGQLNYDTNKQTLISEDLHLAWLKDQSLEIAKLKEEKDNNKKLKQELKESKKKANKNYQESYQLYLNLKQFYSRLGVEAFPDNEIQNVAIKELNKLLSKQKNTPIQKELEYMTTERNMYHSQIEEVLDFIRNEGYDTFEEFKNYFEKLLFEYNDFFEQIKNKGTCGLCQYIDNKRIKELEQEVEEKKTRISELEDKDWYEGLIKQLEDQCDELLQEKEDAELKLADKEKENKNLKNIVDTFDKLKQYDIDAKQIVLINPDNIYANLNGQKLMLKTNKQTIIDELNKLREFISIKHQNKLALHKTGHLTEYGEGSATMCEIIMDKIDTQIQSLEGETND